MSIIERGPCSTCGKSHRPGVCPIKKNADGGEEQTEIKKLNKELIFVEYSPKVSIEEIIALYKQNPYYPYSPSGIEERISTEMDFAAEVQKMLAVWIKKNYQQLKKMLGIDAIGINGSIIVIPDILDMAQRHILKQFGLRAGEYNYQERSVSIITDSHRENFTIDNYLRIMVHELIHFLTDSSKKVGFRQKNKNDPDDHLKGCALSETMTEYQTRKFFQTIQPKNKINFNHEYLERLNFIYALEEMVGKENLLRYFSDDDGLEKLTEELTAMNKIKIRFDYKLLLDIHRLMGDILTTEELTSLVRGDAVTLDLAESRFEPLYKELSLTNQEFTALMRGDDIKINFDEPRFQFLNKEKVLGTLKQVKNFFSLLKNLTVR